MGLGSAWSCKAEGRAGPALQTQGRAPQPPFQAKPKPAALPFTPPTWESGDESDAAIPRPKKKRTTPPSPRAQAPPPPPRPTRDAKPAPNPPRGKDPYDEIPQEGNLVGAVGGGNEEWSVNEGLVVECGMMGWVRGGGTLR